jgi:signal transduction histidine kinase/CheY-like chemotaxis protein
MPLRTLRPPPEPGVQHALFELGFHNLRASVLGSPLTIGTIAWLTHGRATASHWQLWFGVEVLCVLLGLAVWAAFRRHAASGAQPQAATLRRWRWAHLATIGFDGVGAGLVGLLFVPGAVTQNLLIATAFVGAGAFSAVSNAAHNLPAFLVAVSVAAGLMSAFFPVAFGADTPVVLLLCWLYVLMLAWTALQARRTLVETIRLRLANERLATAADAANRDKSDFLAAASHDLRQPVHALMLLVEALRREPENAAAAHRTMLLEGVHEAAQSIRQQFDGLMELSRLESGRQPLQRTPFDLTALLHELVARHRAEAEQRGLDLRLAVSRPYAACWIQVDRLLLDRMLGNLLSNALRYTEHGGVLVTLRSRGEQGVQIGVHDTGSGIAVVDQTRVFEPYVQLGNPERDRRQGVGLGLSLVREGARQLDLTLRLQSHLGRGSCFSLQLPAGLRCAAPAAPAVGPLDPSGLRGQRVLLVDDDPLVRHAMAALMERWGTDLRTAPDGRDDTLNSVCADGWVPHAVISDQRLPGPEPGLVLLGRLQDRWPGCAALLLTGEPASRIEPAASEAGFVVLYKPADPALLAATLQALLPHADPTPCTS